MKNLFINNPVSRKGKQVSIEIEELDPFINTCPVTNFNEKCTVCVSYVPAEKVINLTEFRTRMSVRRAKYVESIADDIYQLLLNGLQPIKLEVTVKLLRDESQGLTPWSVTIKNY